MRPYRFGHPADDRIDIFYIVDNRPVGMPEAIVDGRAVLVHLSVGDHLRGVADVRAIHFA